ncbi:hypothetical protein BDF14DRAFT_1862389 [Spinellus fusiger]|nr:hypothetical protein BDF14DRAFT_1862389 [Spinellus fusiger]
MPILYIKILLEGTCLHNSVVCMFIVVMIKVVESHRFLFLMFLYPIHMKSLDYLKDRDTTLNLLWS